MKKKEKKGIEIKIEKNRGTEKRQKRKAQRNTKIAIDWSSE